MTVLTMAELQREHRKESLNRWAAASMADLVHEFAVVRGDLSEPYAREQLTALLDRKLLLVERDLDTAQEQVQAARALHGPKPGHRHVTVLPSGGRVVRMACTTCTDAYPCATALALGVGRHPHEITLPDYRIGEGWPYCTTCGRDVYLDGFPERVDGPWAHVGSDQQLEVGP